ncbi:hypothetical protein, partial [Escherichia coli]
INKAQIYAWRKGINTLSYILFQLMALIRESFIDIP